MCGSNSPDTKETKHFKDSPAVRDSVLTVLKNGLGDIELPPDAEKGINDALAKLPKEEPETLAQRAAQYDAMTLLKYAVVDWSYDRPIKSGSLEHMELLDVVTKMTSASTAATCAIVNSGEPRMRSSALCIFHELLSSADWPTIASWSM